MYKNIYETVFAAHPLLTKKYRISLVFIGLYKNWKALLSADLILTIDKHNSTAILFENLDKEKNLRK